MGNIVLERQQNELYLRKRFHFKIQFSHTRVSQSFVLSESHITTERHLPHKWVSVCDISVVHEHPCIGGSPAPIMSLIISAAFARASHALTIFPVFNHSCSCASKARISLFWSRLLMTTLGGVFERSLLRARDGAIVIFLVSRLAEQTQNFSPP